IKQPKLLLSESDFTNPITIGKDWEQYKNKKIYDLIYVCSDANEGWQAHNRNWELAQKCFAKVCDKLNLKILIIGRKKYNEKTCNKSTITKMPFLNYWEFIKLMCQTKIVFLPNICDAS